MAKRFSSESKPGYGIHFPANSDAGFSELFLEYHAPLVLYAYRITDNQSAAEDIAVEVFVSLWKRNEPLDQIQSLKAYLYTATRNRALTWNKRHKKETERHHAAASLEENSGLTVMHHMIYAETMGNIYSAMDKLPPQCRRVFILHYVEGKKIAEIAAELKISISSVRTHRGRGIELLQKILLSLLGLLQFLS